MFYNNAIEHMLYKGTKKYPNTKDIDDIMSVLCGGIALSIRSRETPELQAKTLRDIIGHLESEFINVDSFSDVK